MEHRCAAGAAVRGRTMVGDGSAPRRTMRAPKPWVLAAGGFIAGAYLLAFPGGIAHAFFSPQPTIIIRTVSNDHQLTTTAVLGQGKVPIDIDGDSVPDI